MAFIVETGSGTPGANAYTSVAFVTQYLTDRGRQAQNSWNTIGTAAQQAAIVLATDYIENRWGPSFRGSKLNTEVEGRLATGNLELTQLPVDGDEIVLGQRTYRLVDDLVDADDVLIGDDITETVANIVAGIMLEDGALGETVDDDTLPNYQVQAEDDDPSVAIAALVEGENGNLIVFSSTITGAVLTPSGGFLVGGIDSGEQPLSFPRAELYSNDGRAVTGIPLKLKMATAEYAVRAAAAALNPDPVVSDTYQAVSSFREKVGPIEEETRYAEAISGAGIDYIVPYPQADALLTEYVRSAGGARVIRA